MKVGVSPTTRPTVFPLALGAAIIVTTEFLFVGALPAIAVSLQITESHASILISLFALSAAILGPLLTLVWSDYSPTVVLKRCMLALMLSHLALAIVPNLWLYGGIRILQGALLTPFISVASALAAELAPPKDKILAVARVNLGTIMGIVFVVPAFVALEAYLGLTALFLLLAGASLLTHVLLPSTPVPASQTSSIANQLGILKQPMVLLHLAASALTFAVLFMPYSFIRLFINHAFGTAFLGTNETVASLVLLLFGIAGIWGNSLAAHHVEEHPRLTTGILTTAVALCAAMLSVVTNGAWLNLLLFALWGTAHSGSFLACQIRVMQATPQARAFALSLNIAVCNLGIAIGASAGSIALSHGGLGFIWPGCILLSALTITVLARTSRQV